MSDIAETITGAVESAHDRMNTIIALLVALTATFTAVCNVKDGNVVQAMAQAQAKAVDTWAYFQAKSTKENLVEAMADQMTVQRDISPHLAPEQRALLDKKIQE